MKNQLPYRDDLEAQLCSARSEINELKNNLLFAQKQLEKNMNRPNGFGIFLMSITAMLCLLGSVATFCLVIANNYSYTMATGGASLTLAGLGIIGAAVVGANWNKLFQRR